MSLHPDFINELRKCFTGDIRLDLASRTLYSTDASIYQLEPLGVVLPKTQEDLHAAVELAAKYRVPILPRGSGSSLAGQAIGNALIIDCSRWLDSLLEIDLEARTATVEPGLILSRLNLAAAKHGLMFGPDPASAERATMGGVIANNATGAHSLIYGMTADHLLSADVIMSDGSLGVLGERSTLDNPLISALYSSALTIREKYTDAITKQWPTTWRNSAGYRLNYLIPWSPSKPSQWEGAYLSLHPSSFSLQPLLAGSEGTLAVIRRAKINLVPKPKHTILAVLSYQGNAEACDDVPRLLTHRPSAVELVPRMIIRLARGVPEYARQMGWVVGDPAALLVVEFSGDEPSALKERARTIGDVLTIAESKEDQARVWNIRKVGLGLLDSRPQSARPAAFVEDCAIPVQKLGEYVREVEKILFAHGTEGGIYAHASAGCLHTRPILDLKTARGVSDLRSISEAVFALTVRLGGAMSSEHGDGLARSEYLEQTYGPELMEAMHALKRAADPNNLLNPGKILAAQKLDVNLRYGPEYRARVWETNLSFARDGGLDVAIEQCNGQGVCRKDTGVMCPSYQATREEMHSTRGRANLLRAMISGPSSSGVFGLSSFDRERVDAAAEALDLCLACKGCKSECPSGVDMAKLKFAFQSEYYKTHRRQLRDYAFGYFHITAGLAASVAPLSNALLEIPVIRNLVAQILGITPQRPFPKFSSRRAKILATEKIGKKRVIFLADAFARYLEPETEQAALDILSGCGFDVYVLPVLGAGASFLSKGFIDQARRHAARVLDVLNQTDPAREIPVVGIEPPEIYAFKHDYVDLLPRRAEEIKQRVDKVWLLDEFLLRSQAFNDLRIANTEEFSDENSIPTRKVNFHPHCHQRAEGPSSDGLPNGIHATLELLRSCGYEVELMDTGCCGMAGTFGYEAEHYEVSRKVGELKLFPKLRTLGIGDRESGEAVVSSGAACRMQIRQGTGIEALHPIVLVSSFIKGNAR
ncbi:MAG TPA: FAD-linked oxidase C-terminal domain-containing protein [Anaerolineales bacterium]|nr:FAD-linked oxidase C-terminal domain-containing protein [Anaerolineales bacterium]